MARKKIKLQSTGADRSELRRLLQAAKADHWDDGPRLAVADWLEEHGGESDRARAEMIRLQLDTGAGGPDWSLSVDRLREKHVREWVGPHRDFFARKLPRCERGLLVAESKVASWFNGPRPDDEAWDWVESANLNAPTAAEAPRLFASPRLDSVARLRFHNGLGPVAAAAAARRAGHLRSLDLSIHCGYLDGFAAALASGLDEFLLGFWGARQPLAPLLRLPALAGLRSIALETMGLAEEDAEALAHLSALQRLATYGFGLSEAGVARLGTLRLRRLALMGLDAGTETLASSACAETLEEAQFSPLGRACVDWFPRLRRLEVFGSRLGSWIADDLNARPLDEYSLRGCVIDQECLASLAGPGPRTLRLHHCYVEDAGLARLASWPGLSRVRLLDLSDNRLKNTGAMALAASPYLSSLEALDLGDNNGITAKGVDAILSAHGSRLRWLSLPSGRSLEATFKVLIKRRPPLRELRFGWHPLWQVGSAEVIRLRAALPGCAIG